MVRKIRNILRGLLQRHGPDSAKRRLWNSEFSGGRWDCLDSTSGDCVYSHVEKYANNGSILDLGCGSGSTANELDAAKYRDYMGTDISDVAVGKAIERSAANGRSDKNRFLAHDMSSFVPDRRYDVILFRDSIYYIPQARLKTVLNRYSRYLNEGAVFIVRMWHDTKSRKMFAILAMIESDFEILEKYISDEPKAIVIVFRPRLPLA